MCRLRRRLPSTRVGPSTCPAAAFPSLGRPASGEKYYDNCTSAPWTEAAAPPSPLQYSHHLVMAGLSLQGRFPAARGKGAPQASLLPPPAAWGAPKAVKFRLEPFGAPPSTCEPPSYALPPSSLLPVRCMWFLPGPAPVAGLKKEWEMCPSVGRTAIGAPKGRREKERRQQQFLSAQVLGLRVGRSSAA